MRFSLRLFVLAAATLGIAGIFMTSTEDASADKVYLRDGMQYHVSHLTGSGSWVSPEISATDFASGTDPCIEVFTNKQHSNGGIPRSCSNGSSEVTRTWPTDIYITRFIFQAQEWNGFAGSDGCGFRLVGLNGATVLGNELIVPVADGPGVTYGKGSIVAVDVGHLLPAGDEVSIQLRIGPNSVDGTTPSCGPSLGDQDLIIEYQIVSGVVDVNNP